MSVYLRNLANIRKMRGIIKLSIFLFLLIIVQFSPASAQYNSSPANWLYPQGNSEGTRQVELRSGRQFFDSLKVKWSTPLISGHVQPLIGNIVANDKIFSNFPFAPNEMAAVVGDRLVIIDGKGKTVSVTKLPDALNGVVGVSALLDTSFRAPGFPFASPTLVLGLETIEAEREDSLAVAFIVGYNHETGKVDILRRFSMNLKDNAVYPNVSASLKPVYARNDGDEFILYAVFNMAQPKIGNPYFVEPPFLRGLAQFRTSNTISTFPLPDIGDDKNSRITLGPEVNFSQVSQTNKYEGASLIMLPTYPTPSIKDIIPNDVTSSATAANKPYVCALNISNSDIVEDFPLIDASDFAKGSRPKIRPMYVNIQDNATDDSVFVLVIEEYDGRDGSDGTARLHLFDIMGNQLTSPDDMSLPPYLPPSFTGARNHYWSIAVGNVDGNANNDWPPYYPNNRGNEIVATQSSKEFAFAGSKLFVLRYNSGQEIDKPSPPDEYLFPFDTIASQRINGWVAAVNDFDGDLLRDGKEEIFLVNGSEVIVLRMRDYKSVEFRLGMPFDTVFTMNFPNQTISNLAIADMDGDGRNEMIVTTFDSTYVIGTPLPQTIALLEPRYYNAPTLDYCPGDTVLFKWTNLSSTGKAHLLFVETVAGVPTDIDTLTTDIPNSGSEEVFKYVVGERLVGKEGFFIIAAASNPNRNFDTTTVLRFNRPWVDIPDMAARTFYSGSEIYLNGDAYCADSVVFQYTLDGESWETISGGLVNEDHSFSVLSKLPCMDNFDCFEPIKDNKILSRVLAVIGDYVDSTNVFTISVRPAPFPVQWDSCTGSCATLNFRWDSGKMLFPADSVLLLASFDFGLSFTELASFASSDERYSWDVPLSAPDTIMLRFCGVGSCIRTDTLIANYQPKYIKQVSPNPMNYYQTMEMVYTVPRETNVTIRIYDQSNRMIKELQNSAPRVPNIAYCDFWDGKMPDGTPVANGIYYIRLEFSDGSFEFYPIYVRK